MDKFAREIITAHINKAIDSLKKNNMDAVYAPSKEDALKAAAGFMKSGDTVSVGGSMTLFEAGVIDYLRRADVNFLDRYRQGITRGETEKLFRDTFSADVYLTSTNALTQEGELYNVDGTGNRVAAMIYGPKSVVVIAGYNKIVKDRDAAVERVRNIAAPANCIRLGCKTPCIKTGCCMDCKGDVGICCSYVFLGRQRVKDRIKVIIVGEELGY